MLPTNVRITSARYANAQNSLVFVLLDTGETWFVNPNNGSGQANVLAAWVQDGGNIGPYVPPVPGAVVPPGALIWLATNQVPLGYLLCDGSTVKRLQYPKLFSTIGVTFGDGDGATTFNLPDLRGKMIRGWGPVNSIDLNREFGSLQDHTLGEHRHKITDGGHTHGVNDPGHIHGVIDPGHTHGGNDPGHNHTVTDPGHAHGISMYEDNLGPPAVQVAANPVVITPYFDNNGPVYNYFSPDTEYSTAALTVNTASANLETAIGEANVSDQLGLTNISVDPAVTNIVETDPQGGYRTAPANLTLLPFIRY